MKKFKKPASLILAVSLVFALAVSACADNNITASGGSGTTPVSLSSTTDGSSGGDPAGTAMNVTVPTSLPIEVINGTVLTAENARITNNSKSGSVRVSGVEVTNGAYKVGSYNSFSGAKTIALKINGCPTEGPGKLGINTTAFPVIKGEESLALEYFAKISADAPNSENVNALNVVFTISIV